MEDGLAPHEQRVERLLDRLAHLVGDVEHQHRVVGRTGVVGVGAEEIYPLVGRVRAFGKLVGVPYLPVTPFFPLLGPLGMIPLPSKWIIEFGAPVDTASLGPSAADDPMLVFDLTDQVRETIQQTLYALLMQRRSVFF